MKLITSINSEIFNSEKENSNTIYKIEIFSLKIKLESILNIYSSFCDELGNYEYKIMHNKDTFLKKSKLEKILDFGLLYKLCHKNEYLTNIYNNNIKDKKEIDVLCIHLIFKEIIQEYYNAINMVRMARTYKLNKENNVLFNLYLESKKTNNIDLCIFTNLGYCISLIGNDSIKSLCYELFNDYNTKHEETIKLHDEIYEKEREIERFISSNRRNVSNLDELKCYRDLLSTFCENIENKEKQKKII